LYDAQLASYRGSRATVSEAQSTSGASTHSAPPSTSQQNQAASKSSTPTNVSSPSSGQGSSSRLNEGQRFFFALIGSLFAFGAASAFWTSSSVGSGVFAFLLAAFFLFGVVCLYQGQIGRIFFALRVRRPKQQLWVTIGIIVLALLGGKFGSLNPDTHFRGQGEHSATKAQMSQVKIANGSLSQDVAASVPAPPTSDAQDREQPGLGSRAQPIVSKNEPEKITQSQLARQPSPPANAQQLSVVASIAASSGTYGKAARERTEAPWRKSLVGSWVGKYNCAQGVTGLTLTIAELAGGGLSGIFDFYPVPGGSRFTEGSYSGTVTVSPDGSFEFEPQGWISQPSGFTAVALSGHYVADTQRLQGQVTGAIGCTSFDLSRRRSQAQSPSATYDVSGLSALDRASIESACSGARLVQGAASYHRCLNAQLGDLAQHPRTPDLNKLSSVDRASVESACSGARLVQGAASYHQCLDTQLGDLAQHPRTPDLSRLSSVDRSSIESACSGSRLVQGAASYHRCLSTQLDELVRYPDTPDLSGLSSVDRSSIESACSGARLVQGPASYHQCLKHQLSELRGR
jgi:hypothetical protein